VLEKKAWHQKKTLRNHKHVLEKARKSWDLGDRPDRISLFYPTTLYVSNKETKKSDHGKKKKLIEKKKIKTYDNLNERVIKKIKNPMGKNDPSKPKYACWHATHA